jgi:uncharacterized RDD family membrane protein YckC
MQQPNRPTSGPQDLSGPMPPDGQAGIPATVGQRFVNGFIDAIAVWLLFFLINLLLSSLLPDLYAAAPPYPQPASYVIPLRLIQLLAAALLYTVLEGISGGRSVGKLITNTQAVRENGARIGWKDALLRSLCRLVPFEAFSAFGGHPWHDRWTRTMVIQRAPGR